MKKKNKNKNKKKKKNYNTRRANSSRKLPYTDRDLQSDCSP